MIRMMLDCDRPTQSCVITNHLPQCWSEVFFFNLTKTFVCYYRYTIIFHLYFTK